MEYEPFGCIPVLVRCGRHRMGRICRGPAFATKRCPHLHNRSPKPKMLVPPQKYAEMVGLIMMHPDQNVPFLFSMYHFVIWILLLKTLEKNVRFGQSATYCLWCVRGNHTNSIKRTSWSNRRSPMPHLSHWASYPLLWSLCFACKDTRNW